MLSHVLHIVQIVVIVAAIALMGWSLYDRVRGSRTRRTRILLLQERLNAATKALVIVDTALMTVGENLGSLTPERADERGKSIEALLDTAHTLQERLDRAYSEFAEIDNLLQVYGFKTVQTSRLNLITNLLQTVSDARNRSEHVHKWAGLQTKMYNWMRRAFGDTPGNTTVPQRALRLLEEAVEVAQAAGLTKADVKRVMGVVYSKPKGGLWQEIGGLGVTMLTLSECAGFKMLPAIEAECERVLSKNDEHWRARNQQKNAHGLVAQDPRERRRNTLGKHFVLDTEDSAPKVAVGDKGEVHLIVDGFDVDTHLLAQEGAEPVVKEVPLDKFKKIGTADGFTIHAKPARVPVDETGNLYGTKGD